MRVRVCRCGTVDEGEGGERQHGGLAVLKLLTVGVQPELIR